MNLPPLPPMRLTIAGDDPDRGHWYNSDQMREYAAAAVLAERQACAQLCDIEAANSGVAHTGNVLNGLSQKMRHRSSIAASVQKTTGAEERERCSRWAFLEDKDGYLLSKINSGESAPE